jgi:hypothetical protein
MWGKGNYANGGFKAMKGRGRRARYVHVLKLSSGGRSGADLQALNGRHDTRNCGNQRQNKERNIAALIYKQAPSDFGDELVTAH